MNKKEVWKKIDYAEFYEASSHGRVRSLKHKTTSGRILKPGAHKNGYLSVTIPINGKRTTKTIHRLVAIAFGIIEKYDHVNHIDGNRKNNNILNLEKSNPKHNQMHRAYILNKVTKGKYSDEHENIINAKLAGEKTGDILKRYNLNRGTFYTIIKKSWAARKRNALMNLKNGVYLK